jgi:hypothetical protein
MLDTVDAGYCSPTGDGRIRENVHTIEISTLLVRFALPALLGIAIAAASSSMARAADPAYARVFPPGSKQSQLLTLGVSFATSQTNIVWQFTM